MRLKMITTIYYIILIYFVLGGVGFYFINRKKRPEVASKSNLKFITYFFVINILFFSIVINPLVFRYLSVLIIGAGLIELFCLFQKAGYKNFGFHLLALIVYGILSFGFLFFGRLQKELILFSFIVTSIFDSFSQITGQLFGRRQLFRKTSPNKTLGGLIGGGLIAFTSSYLLSSLYFEFNLKFIIFTFGVILFAFAGDLAASFYKRKYGVKDYSKLIPGHGGFLDRFDSLIAAGAWVALSMYVLNF